MSVEDDGRIAAALSRVPRPRLPIYEPWEVSIASLLSQGVNVPSGVKRGLDLLSRFGSIRFDADSVAIDGDSVPWNRITGFELLSAREVFTSRAIAREIERIRVALPPLPGRKWLIGQVSEAVTALAQRAVSAGTVDSRQTIGSISYNASLGRSKRLVPGLVAASIFTLVPEATSCIVEMANHDVETR